MSEQCGDWVLLKDTLTPPLPRRAGDWRMSFSGGGFTLYCAAPRPGWVGAPWREIELETGRAWLWGESLATDRVIAEVARGGDASRLGGRFLLLCFIHEAFELITDRFGTLHAYASSDGRAVSTSFAAAAHFSAKRLDWPGLTSYFACGFFLGERTFWDDIRCLAPARRHQLGGERAGAACSTRYWRWRHKPESSRTEAETVEAFATLFEQVMAELAGTGRVALPLSGGLDSRALAAAAPPGDLAWSFGYGYAKNSVEIRLARQIARQRRIPFDAFVIEGYLPEKIGHAIDLVEGFQDVTQTRQLAIAGPLAEKADRVLAGHWGDVWLDDMGLEASASENEVLSRALAKLRKNGRAWLLEHLCRPQVADPEARLESEVAMHLSEYADIAEPDFRLKAFKTDHWSCRWTLASVRAYQSAAFARLPFYDPRLADFFATVPSSRLRDRRLELDYLRRFAADLARIPWQETGAHLYRSRRRAHWLGMPGRAVNRAVRKLRREQVIERNWEVQLLCPAGRSLLEQRLLRRGLRLHDLVAPREIRSLLESFLSQPSASSGYSVSMLLSFAVFLERS